MDADDERLTTPDTMQHYSRPWYSTKTARATLVVGLVVLLVVILAGPRPKVKSELMDDELPAGEGKAAARGAAVAADSASGGGGGGGTAAASASGGTAEVGFYGESLCPDCQHMVRDVLQPLFDNGVAKLMGLTYYAFGNVKNTSDGGFAYQHGPAEGKYNRHILCAQHFHPKQDDWFPYVKCLADKMHSLDRYADKCASDLGWEAADVSACSEGDKGKELEQEAAAATWALRPQKNFVPWIVVNGVAIGADFENLERYVCAVAPAASRPTACYELPPGLAYQGRRRS
ncbi:hypothetical protein CHLNCDRAFT_145552 [Chlorella variabilis]|uniref:Thioredoxin-like fold domain-containing protein n=1 Tax=Chlorella variabilis TaxID=554065 RepID=E1ZDR1_CHLVA|nr:hypothetical protein CHLNCDRAFT_145552 [Chlorella variabilis]EFN56067.1 hypothetical protein CHLNCDRAFT_145552 [Chlorella variabilis]|eukprot:XP_005848169.1 hypothetical protein CHLNCDRAFT_145552 [Chlorella variabilis]